MTLRRYIADPTQIARGFNGKEFWKGDVASGRNETGIRSGFNWNLFRSRLETQPGSEQVPVLHPNMFSAHDLSITTDGLRFGFAPDLYPICTRFCAQKGKARGDKPLTW